ncbi:chemotaxis protein CheB [Humitalea sp. 24SJ18S-53]|uniref:chemotaxis protein CheB n=1 Tax=Humitalea sp. 24SJ18S-53 TaxID=3422307 RepID=UPI003D66D348
MLIADDSGFMRLALRRIIEADGDLSVVAEAADGEAAVEQAMLHHPDVVAMDMEMPRLDGIEATRRLMRLPDPPAVVMVSQHTSDGSAAALAALAAGASDTVWKGSGLAGLGAGSFDLGALDASLRGRLRHWAAARAAGRMRGAAAPPVPGPSAGVAIILVGASTGGPDAVVALLAAAGRLAVPVVVAQHMPADLGPHFAQSVAERTGLDAMLAVDGARLAPGRVVLLPGGMDGSLLRAPDGGFLLRLAPGAGAVHPSVDVLFRSAALAADRALGVVLTGMGRDGTEGAAAMVRRGMSVLAQSPESCVVAGMPGALIAAGLAAGTGTPDDLGRRMAALV